MFDFFRRRPSDLGPRSSEPPISYDDLRRLFDWLARPNPSTNGTGFVETVEFLDKHRLPRDHTLQWLRSNGGFCDSEVIYNVTDEWGDKVGWSPNEPPEEDVL